MHQPEEPSLDSSHHHQVWEDNERLERHHQSHDGNQKEPCASVVTEGVQTSPASGQPPSGSSDHDQLASHDPGVWPDSVAVVVVQSEAGNLSPVKCAWS